MPAKNLTDVLRGAAIFVDANVFHLYLRGPKSVREVCTQLLERIERGELNGCTSSLVLDELAYKLLLRRIEETHRRNPLEVIEKDPSAIGEASAYVDEGLNILLGIKNLEIMPVERHQVEELATYMKKYSLLPRDALHLSSMMTIGCRDIASTDKYFDSIPGITRWSP
jgi:predicted nucleic acid-binding protein